MTEYALGLEKQQVIILLDQTYVGFAKSIRLEGTVRQIDVKGQSAQIELKSPIEVGGERVSTIQIKPRYEHEKFSRLTSFLPWRRFLIVNALSVLGNKSSSLIGIGKVWIG